jgi:hypothetical protein
MDEHATYLMETVLSSFIDVIMKEIGFSGMKNGRRLTYMFKKCPDIGDWAGTGFQPSHCHSPGQIELTGLS